MIADGTSEEPQSNWLANARSRLEEIERDREEQVRKRREGRPQGQLTESLISRLRSCNPKQLKNVISQCGLLLHAHQAAPSQFDCQRRSQSTVLVSVPVGNRRYQWEKQACGKNCSKCPNHGPYLYVYQRDGAFFPAKSLGTHPFKKPVPRKVLAAIRQFKKQEATGS